MVSDLTYVLIPAWILRMICPSDMAVLYIFLIFIKNYFWTLEPIIFGLLKIKLISDPSVHNDNSNLTIFGNQSISKIT